MAGNADHLRPYQFKKGVKGGKSPHPLKRASKASLTKALNDYLEKNPNVGPQIIEKLVKMALGDIPDDEARRLQQIRSVEAVKELFNRVDGPLVRQQINNIRSDKTVILHDGPAVHIDVGEKAGDGDDTASVIDVEPIRE